MSLKSIYIIDLSFFLRSKFLVLRLKLLIFNKLKNLKSSEIQNTKSTLFSLLESIKVLICLLLVSIFEKMENNADEKEYYIIYLLSES